MGCTTSWLVETAGVGRGVTLRFFLYTYLACMTQAFGLFLQQIISGGHAGPDCLRVGYRQWNSAWGLKDRKAEDGQISNAYQLL